MVIANASDGSTAAFDLTNATQLAALQALISSGLITALSLHSGGSQISLTLPKRFRRARVAFGAELLRNGDARPIAERIYVQADDVRVTLTLSLKSRLIRCDLARTGRMLYNPVRR
jgi:hypothetical protein